LHDIGKLGAYSIDLAPQITLYGAVIDHIPLGYSMFMDFARKYDLDENTILAIGHDHSESSRKERIRISRSASTPEALIVSAADELDFLIYCWDSAYPADELSLSEYNGPAQRALLENISVNLAWFYQKARDVLIWQLITFHRNKSLKPTICLLHLVERPGTARFASGLSWLLNKVPFSARYSK